MTYVYPSVGNDPELFITTKGKLIPAEKIFPEPIEQPNRSVKVDNAAVELNFPADTCLQMNLGEIARTLRILKNKLNPKIHRISLTPAMEIESEDMVCKSVLQFGCSPSLVFEDDDLRVSKPSVNPREVRYRSIGFHIHLGMLRPNQIHSSFGEEYINASKLLHTTEGRVRLVRVCDYVAGLPAVLLERNDKAVQARRNLLGYGRAGEFREQPHGFEYRTLGPWPMINPRWAWWANSAVRDALQLVLMGLDTELIKQVPSTEVASAINTNNNLLAARLWADVKKVLRDVIKDAYDENEKHAIFGLRNIKMFEFAVIKGGLKKDKFSFRSWPTLPYQEHFTMARKGFPVRMEQYVKSSRHFKDYAEFCSRWELTKDNISPHI